MGSLATQGFNNTMTPTRVDPLGSSNAPAVKRTPPTSGRKQKNPGTHIARVKITIVPRRMDGARGTSLSSCSLRFGAMWWTVSSH